MELFRCGEQITGTKKIFSIDNIDMLKAIFRNLQASRLPWQSKNVEKAAILGSFNFFLFKVGILFLDAYTPLVSD